MLKYFLKETPKVPLGRWHNCGIYFNEKYLKLKEIQKEERIKIQKEKIDPYEPFKYNDDHYLELFF